MFSLTQMNKFKNLKERERVKFEGEDPWQEALHTLSNEIFSVYLQNELTVTGTWRIWQKNLAGLLPTQQDGTPFLQALPTSHERGHRLPHTHKRTSPVLYSAARISCIANHLCKINSSSAWWLVELSNSSFDASEVRFPQPQGHPQISHRNSILSWASVGPASTWGSPADREHKYHLQFSGTRDTGLCIWEWPFSNMSSNAAIC